VNIRNYFWRIGFGILLVVLNGSSVFAGLPEFVEFLRKNNLDVQVCPDLIGYPAGTYCFTFPSISQADPNLIELRTRKNIESKSSMLFHDYLDVQWLEVKDGTALNIVTQEVYSFQDLVKRKGIPYQKAKLETVREMPAFLTSHESLHRTAWNTLQLESAPAALVSTIAMTQTVIAEKIGQRRDASKFDNILSPHHSRVRLRKGPETKFIHANYVRLQGHQDFIATQNPEPNTTDDFWNMIVQENVAIIVNLTRPEEGFVYWPETEGEEGAITWGNLQLQLLENPRVGKSWIERTVQVRRKNLESKTEQVQNVTLLHYINWEDGTGLREIQMLDLFMDRVEAFQEAYSGNHPLLVHCLAGVGRTGTFIAKKALRKMQANPDREVGRSSLDDALEIVTQIRAQRGPFAVAKFEQFMMFFALP
jgi:protein tyrosine phosphatase